MTPSVASELYAIGAAIVDAQEAVLRLVRALPDYVTWSAAHLTGDELVIAVLYLPNLTPSERHRIAEAMVHEDEATLRLIWEEATARLCAPCERVPGPHSEAVSAGPGESPGEAAG